MLFGLTTTYAQCLSPLKLWVREGRWFSLGDPFPQPIILSATT